MSRLRCIRLNQSLLIPGFMRFLCSSSYTYRTHSCGELTLSNVGQRVTLCGWTKKKRAVGSTQSCFLPLADHSGFTQLLVDQEIWKDALSSIKSESVVRASGIVAGRPIRDQRQSDMTGSIEVQVDSLEILSPVLDTMPFLPHSKALPSSEEVKLRERPLYLRTPSMQTNLRLRSQVSMAMREFLVHSHGFVEVETPTLFRRTSEMGAREFLVPTRNSGKFYSLPQSPQQFKQLLMVGGMDRYFQFARCYRDEDLRADRQPEFTQVDLEMSFVESSGVMSLTEELICSTLSKTVPHFDFPSPPFPRITYAEAMTKYGTDKPDTREDSNDGSKLNFLWVTDFPLFSKTEHGSFVSTHHLFTAPVPEDQELLFSEDTSTLEKVRGQHYDLVVNGVEVGGGSIRIHQRALQEHVINNVLGISTGEFASFLKHLGYGCPPHGGIALGFDRLMSILCKANSMKDVIAFPKSFTGRDLLMESPSNIEENALKEYKISLAKGLKTDS